MPCATITTDFTKYDLKSLQGAWIELRPLPFGLKLERRDMATRMRLDALAAPKKGKKVDQEATQSIELEQFSKKATVFDLAYCVGDHNLTDMNERKLDLKDVRTLDFLEPRVGTEIEELLATLNGDLEDLEDFQKPSTSSSVEAKTGLKDETNK